MAIQNINLGTAPKGEGGDTLRSTATKINENFSNATHAASRLLGTATGNVMEVGAFGLGGTGSARYLPPTEDLRTTPNGFYTLENGGHTGIMVKQSGGSGTTRMGILGFPADISVTAPFYYQINTISGTTLNELQTYRHTFWTTQNVTKDSNGFLKGASPIVKVHADKVVLNNEAEQQNVTFKKNGIGDYTIITESGLSTDGWYIELPKDMNGNPKVAVTLSEVEGVISLKTYKRIFSMETFTFEPDLDNPLDIPTDRWIDIRLNEIPVEQPEMPLEPTEGTNTPVAEAKAPSEPVEPYSEV